MSFLNEIVDLNKEIQEAKINLNNYSRYYPLPDNLKQLLMLMDMNTNNQSFRNYISCKCLEPLKDCIEESQKSIPGHIIDKEEYKKHIVTQMKEVSQSVFRCFNRGYEYYKP